MVLILFFQSCIMLLSLLLSPVVLGFLYASFLLLWPIQRSSPSKSLRIAFIHPDLGVGGAEKLVVEAAVSLKQLGHHVEIFTSYHDPKKCFPQTIDGTLNVTVYGNWLPYHSKGSFQLLKALLRFFYLSFALLRQNRETPFDVIFVDQISATIPLLRFSEAKVLFYCHFPDQLLTQRMSLLKRLYRAPLDLLEELTTGAADRILVNSNFTRRVFRETFKRIRADPEILYPAVKIANTEPIPKPFASPHSQSPITLVSLNRFERKKNIGLALEAFALLKNHPLYRQNRLHLVIAGGYDLKVSENVEHLEELKTLANSLGLSDRVSFRPAMPTEELSLLLGGALCLLYTPEREHFGIVPLEAGLYGSPVIACNSGGPLETIVDGSTGFLRPPHPVQWADAITTLLDDLPRAIQMGLNGQARVRLQFSFDLFAAQLDRIVKELAEVPPFNRVATQSVNSHRRKSNGKKMPDSKKDL